MRHHAAGSNSACCLCARWITSAALARVCRRPAKIGPGFVRGPRGWSPGLSHENSHLRFSAAHCRAFGGQASAPRVPTATVPAMGSAAFGAGAGKSEEPLGRMPVTLADLAGLPDGDMLLLTYLMEGQEALVLQLPATSSKAPQRAAYV